jgi:hypothetical protein
MKNWISISFHLILWLVFLTTPATDMYACGNNCCKKPEKSEQSVQKEAEKSNCCSKEAEKCQHSHKKDSKKGCGDDCNCSITIHYVADLSQKLIFHFIFQTDFVKKSDFLYQQATPKSVIHAVWQPPITFLS